MLKDYLKNIAYQLRTQSETVKAENILVGKPWAIIDGENQMQRLIFSSDGSLVLSINGQARTGKWRYFPEARSLMIDRVTDQILCKEAFINEGVMILRKDGTEDEFFALANENVVPDLDVAAYLRKLRKIKLRIVEKRLIDGRLLEIHRSEGCMTPQKGDRVTIDGQNIEDGMYRQLLYSEAYKIRGGKIQQIVTEKKYINPDGLVIVIQQQSPFGISPGDCAFTSIEKHPHGVVNFSKKKNLILEYGFVVKMVHKNRILRWIYSWWS